MVAGPQNEGSKPNQNFCTVKNTSKNKPPTSILPVFYAKSFCVLSRLELNFKELPFVTLISVVADLWERRHKKTCSATLVTLTNSQVHCGRLHPGCQIK